MSMEKIFTVEKVEELSEIVDFILNIKVSSPVIFLYGNLGAGKTEFVRSFSKRFGIDNVSSPTFNIVHCYENDNVKITHIDLYRITSLSHFFELDPYQLFEESTFTFIEWPEILDSLDFNDYHLIKIFFEFFDDKRKVKILC
ncbi:MAG: ATPase, YjeE family protein [candidate division TA06 bacterium 32_111]|uniref:tRNA threonylcarbamoyladenosine biosynthesis protein TsaE n=1 Tax=candidate division WOR-3 bacterium TaxID=2052148 RepID=A0A348MML1_UNCW3|nr:MAG: ATPase, YjeE family protein [candidate division TA06 bacterium 32_111]HAF08287.1 tRNA (adenosine(37)-N6)-threonylcarbamoyltransferase complex ATPase subunit type 1 TsaE [candidate division WOR-3 bacterium]